MPRKVLLSFLGNNPYKETCYHFKKKKSKVVRFVQEAIIQLHCKDWTPKDQVYIFLTAAAAKNNWEGAFYQGNGLATALKAFPHLSIQPIESVPKGISAQEIWTLFDNIYQYLQPKDEVYLDITNGFRSLPMLLMVLLDYAKVLKAINVRGIYYGAFEVLSPYPKIEENFPNREERLVPILDLTSFSALQDWTAAAADFELYGKINRLSSLTKASLAPISKESEEDRMAVQTLQKIDQDMQQLIPLLLTNRGKRLAEFDFDGLNNNLLRFSKDKKLIKPLSPVVERIQDKLQHFKNKDELGWLKTARWCTEHGLIQQGITQLHEGFITWFCFRFKQMTGDIFFDAYAKEARSLVNGVFTVIEKKIPERKWRNVVGRQSHYTKILLQDPLMQQAVWLVRGLNELRNDINHGGYILKAEPDTFVKKLDQYLQEITQIVEAPKVKYPIKKGTGLLNFTEYPFETWSIKPQKMTLKEYQKVEDMPFPTIATNLSREDFEALVEQSFRQIKALQPEAVHIMGEVTFTFALVQRLKNIGITCIAAVGVKRGRVVVEQFDFEWFREY